MTVAERLRDAARPTNAIGNGTPSKPGHAAGGSAGGREGGEPAYLAEPEGIARAYYVEQHGDERRYWQDYGRSSLVMRATATTVSSKREDLNTVRAMLDLAAARAWPSLELSGSATFRREAWIEAQARGLEARGHRPSDPDRQEAERRRAERQPSTGRMDPTVSSAPTEATKSSTSGRPDPAPGDAARAPTPADHDRQVREARVELSPDGRLVLTALSNTIERQMQRLNIEGKAELRAFVAGELVRKEHTEGPVVLSAEQRRAAAAPEPPQHLAEPPRRAEPEPPRRAIGR